MAARRGGYVTTRDRIFDLLTGEGYRGLTWKEAAARTGWHHGKVSGALSALHDERRVARLREKRDGCSVYVVTEMAGHRPVVTKEAQIDWKERATRAERVLDAVRMGRTRQYGRLWHITGAIHTDTPVLHSWQDRAARDLVDEAARHGHTVVGPVSWMPPVACYRRDDDGEFHPWGVEHGPHTNATWWLHRASVPIIPAQ